MTTAVTASRHAGRPAAPSAGKRSSLRLLAHQVRYEQLSFWRNPQSAVFTFIFPVVFVVTILVLGGIVHGPPFPPPPTKKPELVLPGMAASKFLLAV